MSLISSVITTNVPCYNGKKIENGQYMVQLNCESTWVAQDFHTLPSIISVDNKLYTKNTTLGKFLSYQVSYPPLIDFKGLSSSFINATYDNTTCSNRCCKKVEVLTTPSSKCDTDWTLCATLNPNSISPRCNAYLESNCSAWVPCDINDRSMFYASWAVLFAVFIILFFGSCYKIQVSNKFRFTQAIELLTYSFPLVIIFSFALVSVSDFEHWIKNTETNLEFITFQECTRFCNAIMDPNIISTRFCEDNHKNLSEFRIFEENRNNLLTSNKTCDSNAFDTDDSVFCQSCYSHIDEWRFVQTTINYLKYRVHLNWTLILLSVICSFAPYYSGMPEDKAQTTSQVIGVFSGYVLFLAQIAFLAGDSYFVYQTQHTRLSVGIEHLFGFGQSLSPDIHAIVCSLVAFDLICFVGIVCWCCVSEIKENNTQEESERPPIGDPKKSVGVLFNQDTRRSLITMASTRRCGSINTTNHF